MNVQALNRSDIVTEAREWLDTPYMHLRREKGKFTDCVGLIIGVARKFNLGDYRKRDYSKIPNPKQMELELYRALNPIDPSDIQPGDILWFAFRHPRTRIATPRHVAIVGDYYLGGHSIIHAYCEAKKVVEHRLDPKWQRRICGAFKFRGIT